MKKILGVCLALSMLMAFTACAPQNNVSDTTEGSIATTQQGGEISLSGTEGTTGETDSTTTLAETTSETSQNTAPSTTKSSTTVTRPSKGTTTAATKSTTSQTAATTKPAEEAQSLEDLMELVYTDFEKPMLQNVKINPEDTEYYLGVKDLQFEEALASEAMITSMAHSVCLIRVADGTDIEQMKKDIKENVNSFKWICVGVEKENVIVDNVGNTIILILDNQNRQQLHENFLQYAK